MRQLHREQERPSNRRGRARMGKRQLICDEMFAHFVEAKAGARRRHPEPGQRMVIARRIYLAPRLRIVEARARPADA
jgi:hypothetical protein